MSTNSTAVEINPTIPATHSIIWLHGLGADGYDFVDIVPQLNLAGVRFIFPHAPVRQVTCMGSTCMRAWFDIMELGKESPCDFEEAQHLVNNLIHQEIARGIPSNHIILAGFSQGGALALQCGLRFPEPLAGILVLSSWLPCSTSLAQEKTAGNQDTPILMIHGTEDQVVNLSLATQSSHELKALGYNITFTTYPMAHTVCPAEIKEIATWIKNV